MKQKVSFRFLWMGQSFANLGDVFYIVGLVAILYMESGSAFYVAVLPFLNTFGRFAGGIASPVLFSAFSLKRVLACSQILKTILLVMLCSIYIGTNVSVVFVFACIVFIAFLDGFASPAMTAMVPRLVEYDEIVRANSFLSVVTETIQLGGWAVGGLLVALFNGPSILWITCVLFILSSIMMALLQDPVHNTSNQRNTKAFISQLTKGWKLIWFSPLYRTIHILLLLEVMASVVWIAAILYVFVAEVLQVSEAWWGYINTTFFIGLLIGGIGCSKLFRFVEHHTRTLFLLSSIGVCAVTVWFGLNYVPWIALFLSILVGILGQIKSITIDSILQKRASTEDLPILYGAQGALLSLSFGVSSLLFGAMTEWKGAPIAFMAAGSILGLAAIIGWINKENFPKNID
ncbi:MAG: MFS transporter [Myxosarcina sp. JB018]|nr:MFS transporter [Myxosarcina sp. JB018]